MSLKKFLLLICVFLSTVFFACDFSDDKNETDSSSSSYAEIHNANATYYTSRSVTACQIENVPAGCYTCALHEDTLNAEGLEGACLEITGPKGTIKAVVVDCLPNTDSGVSYGDVDIYTADAFSKIAEVSDGRVSISYKVVALPTSENVKYNVKETNDYWLGMTMENQKWPVKKIEIKDGSEWVALSKNTANRTYNYYTYNPGKKIPVPATFRLTDIRGNSFTDENVFSSVTKGSYTGSGNFD